MNLYKKVEVKREDGCWHEFYVLADLNDILEQYDVKERISRLTVERDTWKSLAEQHANRERIFKRRVISAPPITIVDDDDMNNFLRGPIDDIG